MILRLIIGFLVLSFGVGPEPEAGEIYQWIDKDGVQHFTDGPPPPDAQVVEGLSETPSEEPTANSDPPNRKDAGTIENDENSPPDRVDTGSVEDAEDGATYREEYWRRLGWGDDSSDPKEAGTAEGGENEQPDREPDKTPDD